MFCRMELCSLQKLKGEDVPPVIYSAQDALVQDPFHPQPARVMSSATAGLDLGGQNVLKSPFNASESAVGGNLMATLMASGKRSAEGEHGVDGHQHKRAAVDTEFFI